MRLIDADVLKQHIDKLPALPDGNFAGNHSALKALINMQPTIEPSTNCSEIPNGSDDTISRQAAIDAVDVLCQEHRYRIPGKRETYSQYNEAWQDALDRAEVAIGNLPSAQPETATITIGRTKGGVVMWYECDACGEPIDQKDCYCRNCGRKLKYE